MRHQKNKSYVMFGIVMIAFFVLTLSGCATGVNASNQYPQASAAANLNSEHTIDVANKDGIGEYLVDHKGITLYYLSSDVQGISTASKNVLKDWPPFGTNKFVVPSSLNAADFSNIEKSFYGLGLANNQSTYRGWPLYYSDLDKKPGDTLGNGINGFFVVSPTITPAPLPSNTSAN